jgi:hypothetical protein
MRLTRLLRAPALLALVLIAGCGVDLKLAASAKVTCSSDGDCPGGWVCPATLGRCVLPGGDVTAPALVPSSLVVTPARVGLATPSLTVAFQVSEALARDPEVSIRLAGPAALTRTLSVVSRDDTTHAYVFAYAPVPGSDPEGDVALVAHLVDVAGNEARAELPRVAILDFTPPAVATDVGGTPVTSVALTPPATSPLSAVTAVTAGTVLRVDFAAAETLAGGANAPVVKLGSGASALTLGQLSGNGLSYVYQAVVGSGLADGPTQLTAHLVDLAGNSADVSLGTVLVKAQRPSSPAVGTSDAILFHRIPWGSQATGGGEAYFLRGVAGSVPANALVVVYSDPVVVTSGAALVGREVARTWADANGAFGGDVGDPQPFQLYMGDSPDVYVAAVDAAGNVSDADGVAANGAQAALVRDVAWTATMHGKIAGRTFPNPHAFDGRQVWTTTLAQSGGVPVATPGDVSLQDGVRASVRGAPHWLPARTYAPLGYRSDVGMAHDPVRGCRVAFGGESWDGCDGGFYCGQWESCRGGAWRAPTISDPEGDGNPSLWYDLPLVFAGGRGTTVLHDGTDVWEWDGTSWRRVVMANAPGTGPVARTGHAIAYDEARQRLLLFGGITSPGGAFLGDTWETDFKSWTRVCTACVAGSTAPPARSAHAMAYDPVRKVTVLVGGRVSNTPTFDAGTWTWDGAAGTWTRRCNTGTCATVSQRENTTLAFNTTLNRAVLFGGNTGAAIDGATYEWDGTAWAAKCTTAPCNATVPAARAQASMFHDPDRKRTVLFGGIVGSFGGVAECMSNFCGTEWEWDGSAWSQIVAPNPGPPAVSGVTPVYDPVRDRVVLFGGQSGGAYSSATYLWDGSQWSNASPATVPAARSRYAAAWVQTGPSTGYIWLATGENAGIPMTSTVWWSGSNWSSFPSVPTARTQSAMAMSTRTAAGAVLFGGRDASATSLCDTWEYLSSGGSWTQVRNNTCGTSVDPSARSGHAMTRALGGTGAFAAQPVVMFGGLATSALNDVWTWTGATTGTWTLVSADGAPSTTRPPRRTEADLLFDTARNRVLMFGGNVGPVVSSVNCIDNYGGPVCHDYWEWSGSAWARVWPVDLHGDGSPAAGSLAGMAFDTTRKLGVGLELRGTSSSTWWWHGGADERPGEVMSVVFDAAQVLRPFDVRDLQVTWVGGGSGAPGGTTTPGAAVQLWDNTVWRQLVSSATASPTATESLAWSLSTDATYGSSPLAERKRFMVGDQRVLYFALVPNSPSGSADGMGEVATDYVEVTVRYQLGP